MISFIIHVTRNIPQHGNSAFYEGVGGYVEEEEEDDDDDAAAAAASDTRPITRKTKTKRFRSCALNSKEEGKKAKKIRKSHQGTKGKQKTI
jgi:hypothetical protein